MNLKNELKNELLYTVLTIYNMSFRRNSIPIPFSPGTDVGLGGPRGSRGAKIAGPSQIASWKALAKCSWTRRRETGGRPARERGPARTAVVEKGIGLTGGSGVQFLTIYHGLIQYTQFVVERPNVYPNPLERIGLTVLWHALAKILSFSEFPPNPVMRPRKESVQEY